MNDIIIRPARPEEIAPALELAHRICQEFVRPGVNTAGKYDVERETTFVAVAGERIVGMVSQCDGCHIRKLYVDGEFHRRGIATGLLDAAIQSMDAWRVTLNSSAYALPFYLQYGFMQADEEQNHGGLIFTPMAYERAQPMHIAVRPARPEEIRPALEFAQKMFVKYVFPDLEPPASDRFGTELVGEEQVLRYMDGPELTFVACDGSRIIGMACEGNGAHIRKLYVDGAYHRRGIATGLLDAIIAGMSANRITVNSSRYGLPFYLQYGFRPTDTEQNNDGFVSTPMAYDKGA